MASFEVNTNTNTNGCVSTSQSISFSSFNYFESAVREWMCAGKPEDGRFTPYEREVIASCFLLSNMVERGDPLRSFGLKYNCACSKTCPCQEQLQNP